MFRRTRTLRGAAFVFAALAFAPLAGYAQQGTKPSSDVNVINTPAVTVANTPSVLDANDLHPFQQTGSATVQQFAEAAHVDFTVPQGKRLVIEFVSIRVIVRPGQEVSAVIAASGLDTPVSEHQVTMNHQRSTDVIGSVFVGAQQMKMYADPGHTVSLVAARSAGGLAVLGEMRVTAAVTGYLLDAE